MYIKPYFQGVEKLLIPCFLLSHKGFVFKWTGTKTGQVWIAHWKNAIVFSALPARLLWGNRMKWLQVSAMNKAGGNLIVTVSGGKILNCSKCFAARRFSVDTLLHLRQIKIAATLVGTSSFNLVGKSIFCNVIFKCLSQLALSMWRAWVV